MVVNFPPELERELEARVAIGEYASAEDLLQTAVSRLFADDFAPGELARLCQEGLDDIDAGLVVDGPEAIRQIMVEGRAARAAARAATKATA